MQPKAQSRLEAFRTHRDHFFAHDPDSPLDPADREGFAGLDYFPERKDLALELPLDESGPGVGEAVTLATSDGQERPFVRAGRITFDIDGQSVTLTVFREQGRGRYFLPFKDATSGGETYEGGRYLDPRARPDGKLVVDLNYAYNPYCAYSDGWSCPAPPFENIVRTRIEAGEKAFVRTKGDESVG
ncbi:MAG TPA: DUF1684 domain-containing protein [Thermomicrobiales bacterium]|nr:DUF1684 domain-containing protein [Thermomicrobiales bacterium]